MLKNCLSKLHSLCYFMIAHYVYIYIYIYIYILYIYYIYTHTYIYSAIYIERECLSTLLHWYQQCGTVHHVPRCMSCHKAIVVLTGRAHCFHDNICYVHLASVRFEHSMSWIFYDHIYYTPCLAFLSTLCFISTSNV